MKTQLDNNALKILEADFNDILRNIARDEKFNEFKSHYENMLNELKISHQKEKDLVGQCQEFKKSMNENANKLKAVMQIASDDSQTITKL